MFNKYKGYGFSVSVYVTPLYWTLEAGQVGIMRYSQYYLKVGPISLTLSLGEVEEGLD